MGNAGEPVRKEKSLFLKVEVDVASVETNKNTTTSFSK